MKKIFITLLIISGYSYAQEYQITSVPVIQYSVDRYTNEIYYKNYITGDIYKTNSTGTYHIISEFPSVPQFSNNSHTAAFMENHNLYLHNFDEDTSYFLANLPYFFTKLLFSPSDDKIIDGGGDWVPIVYYSFEDSSVHNAGNAIYIDVIDWLNDSMLVYITLGGVDIRTLNINNLNENLVVPSAYLVNLRGLATNDNIGAFAYSWEYNSTENTFINLYYPQTGLDTTIYNFIEQGPHPGFYIDIFIRDLIWERNSNKLGFIGVVPTVPLSYIFAFDYNNSVPYLYTEPFINGGGIKYDLQWLNTDTTTYIDWTDYGLLFGLDVTIPVSVKENSNKVEDNLDIKVYPNPFNNATSIHINVPATGDLTIELFNCLGENIGKKRYDYIVAGSFNFDWNEIKNTKDLPAGIYFIRTHFSNREYSSQKTVKLVYLK
jgi:hypothetical protein